VQIGRFETFKNGGAMLRLYRNGWVAVAGVLAVAISAFAAPAGSRIKDITSLEGDRPNQLYGLGLVIGLDGTGGKSLFTQQLAVDMLQKLDVSSKIVTEFKTDNVFKSENIAAVMVTAELPSYARRGSKIDVTVSSIDGANLQGGTLLLTPLRGVDGEVYSVAQGELSIGGFAFSGQAAKAQKNHPTVGRIVNGGIVEKEALGAVDLGGFARLLLKHADYHTAQAIAKSINANHAGAAAVIDAGTVRVTRPKNFDGDLGEFISSISLMEVMPDVPARVVINERTGTVVAGERVRISTVAIAHGNLTITTAEEPQVSQPLPFSDGETTVVDRTRVDVQEQGGALQVIEQSVTVAELARALNALGVTPRDLISIFQALKQAGALHAELVIM
jgi:flagellar P-ring protein precursor FlgI